VNAHDRVRKEFIREAARMFGGGYHCSEIMFSLATRAWARAVDPDLARIASGFGGGIGEAGDLCGCVTGGVMAIGLLHGRTDAKAGNPPAYRLSREYHDRFQDVNGFLQCRDHTGGKFDRRSLRRCTQVVMRGLDILLDLLEENQDVVSPWRLDKIRPLAQATESSAD